ncbi:DUF262 domain-containing protein [Luteipulveratus mongoliensis]|uniref:DUF262 domain-containing protein n=1 Tax=Luteipulveratus mongoliensis TaxID=571913 RepID=A0A0K1JDU2_9MICO|nr:DUF262 domain-containing protein [Luteipulveratus mongoliensis]AKU14874.1 hypothetical protein VV02_01665 [Luteipulveratus mongoliensis]
MPNNAVTLLGALKERLFVVPDYQRPYAWEKRQLDDLWQDLDLMADGSKHYTGTLVLKDRSTEHLTDAGDTVVECEVVDGQQRLTTCLILIDRLRRAFGSMANEQARSRADNLARTYGRVSIDGVPKARLQLADDLNEHWLTCILGDGQQAKAQLTAGEERLELAAAFFDSRIASLIGGFDEETALTTLQRLQTRVTNGLRFLVYEVEPESHAGEIFETLNGRGRDLTEMEKIKNYLLFLADSLPPARAAALVGEINRAWSRIYDHLAGYNANEDLLLRAHWLATQDPSARSWRGAVSVKEFLSRERFIPGSARLTVSEQSEEDAEQLQDDLVNTVAAYVTSLQNCALFTREFLDPRAAFQSFDDHAAPSRASSAHLRRSGVTAIFRPLLFAARLTHPRDGQLYVDLVDACERYSARVFAIGQKRSDSGQARLYRLAFELYSDSPAKAVLDEINELTWTYGDDDTVRAGLGPHENWYWRPGHKYFLYEYELSKAARPSDVQDFETHFIGSRSPRTTEHILPQKPRWDSDDWDTFTEEEHAQLVNGIGNLMLTDDNSSYSRKPFASKKGVRGQQTPPCYAESKLFQEREVAETFESWTAATIDQRRRALVTWALERWPITPPVTGSVEDEIPVGADDALELDTEDDAITAASEEMSS